MKKMLLLTILLIPALVLAHDSPAHQEDHTDQDVDFSSINPIHYFSKGHLLAGIIASVLWIGALKALFDLSSLIIARLIK